ncbi:hypothetical protein [Elioraea tepidiphila]|jgi:hypothetical protein|uniref:hypothetical protein n=1 Tax=Elioraea tepidiphila TaxID=457934 RepID=UPI00036D57E5|nr:hypothetical protein [Elioraea tepidiphila]
MQATRYLLEQVLRKRPYLQPAWCEAVIADPLRREDQGDGRIRFWGAVTDPRDGRTRIRRPVAPGDRTTIHNAVFDRDV